MAPTPVASARTVSGRRQSGRRILTAYLCLFFAFLYVPVLLLLFMSVNNSQTMEARPRGFTLHWFQVVAETPGIRSAIGNSMLVGTVSACVGTALAVLIALGFRHEFPFKTFVSRIILFPIVVPGIVSGVVYMMFFGIMGVQPGLWTTVLPAHVTWVMPFAFLTVFPRIAAVDRSLEEAAMDLGATPTVVFRRVVLPLIRPAVIATVLFSFTLSFDEFIRTFFLSGRERTIPVYLWDLLSDQMAPFLPAVGVVVMAISVLASLAGFLVSAWANHRNTSVTP